MAAIQRHTVQAWIDGRITIEDATGMLAIDETELRRLADETRPVEERTHLPFTND